MISNFKQINRGVSNTVGILILLAITVMLAAVIGNFIFGFTDLKESVNAGATIDITNDSAEVVWNTNQNGELVEVKVNNNLVETLNKVGETTTINNLSTGDEITAVGVRKDQRQTLASATVTNGFETEEYITQNTNLIKSLPNSKNTSADGWSIFDASNGSISDYTTNSNLQITDSTNIYTELPLNVKVDIYTVDETQIKIDVDSINSGTPTYKIGYDYDASTNSFNGNTLSQGELDEGVNNIAIDPAYKTTSLTAVVEGGSSVDVVYNSIQYESLVNARNIPVQYPEGNKWSNITEQSNEILSQLGVPEEDYTVTDSTLIKNTNNHIYPELLNVSNTDYIRVNADIEKIASYGWNKTVGGKNVTEGENTLTFNVKSKNIFVPILQNIKEINSLKVESVSVSEEPVDTTFTITNKETGEVVSNADVTIDGTTKTTDSTGKVKFTISQGEKTINLSKEKYPTKDKTKLVLSDKVSIEYEDKFARVTSDFELKYALLSNDPIKLQNDIDYSENLWNDDYNNSFDGNGYSITNLNLSSTDKNTNFVSLGPEGVWKNTTFEGGSIENNSPEETDDYQVRYTNIFDENQGTISNITVDGFSFKGSENVTEPGGGELISVVGDNKGVIEDTVIKNSSFEGKEEVASLANTNADGTIKNITVKNTTITNTQDVEGAAGLVYLNSYDNTPADEVIRDITMTDVTINAVEDAGGITVSNNAVIEDVTVSNIEVGIENTNGSVGGITAFNDTDAEINNTSVTGSITGLTGESDQMGYVGGIAGQSRGDITNSTSEATVTGNHGVGGLVGDLRGTVSNSVAKGDVIVNVGSEWDGSYGHADSGGFAGSLSDEGEINQSYSTGDVTVTGYTTSIGGFIGDIYSSDSQTTVSNSYSTGNVVASNSERIGGFVGDTDISDTGSILIENSYATGSVSGNSDVGGFVGRNNATINSSYATGSVTGEEEVGGLVGEVYEGSVSDSYWDTESSGHTTGYGVNNGTFNATGLTTSEMQGSSASSNMSNLDFSSTWVTVSSDYPELQNTP